jgi:hypothetical protein
MPQFEFIGGCGCAAAVEAFQQRFFKAKQHIFIFDTAIWFANGLNAGVGGGGSRHRQG